MTMLTIELTDLSVETLSALIARAKQRKAASLEAYVQALIEQDIQADLHPASPNEKEHPLAKVIGSMSGGTWREIMEEMQRERMEEDRQAEQEEQEPVSVPL